MKTSFIIIREFLERHFFSKKFRYLTYKTYCEIKCIRIINSSFKIIAIEIKEQYSAFHSDITSSDTQGSIVGPIVFNLFYVIFSMSMEIINPFESITPFLYPLKTSENLTVFLCFQGEEKVGSSRQEVLCEKGVLRNFTKFTRKHLCRSLFFNKVAGLRRRCFLVNFMKFLRTPFLTEHLWWLLLTNELLMNVANFAPRLFRNLENRCKQNMLSVV